MKIAISKGSGSEKYAMYGKWLQQVDPSVEMVDLTALGSVEEAKEKLKECSGLILSGGPDVHPARYNSEDLLPLCKTIDEERDELEFALVEVARDLRLPTLGICRGAQLLNVAYGGTLYADIPEQLKTSTEHSPVESVDSQHTVSVEPGSLIKRICRVLDSDVNSAHHQSVHHLANIFTPSAIADDGVIEAFEWGDSSIGGKPFLLAVQWHPERMDFTSPMSGPIAEHFVMETSAYETLLKRA